MELHEAINHQKINVFDIVTQKNGKFDIYTYRKPGETKEQFDDRDYKNLMFAIKLKGNK
jgi:hypothetical protein